MNGSIDLVIVDCDGVVIDSELLVVEVKLLMLAQLGRPLSRTRCDACHGSGQPERLRAALIKEPLPERDPRWSRNSTLQSSPAFPLRTRHTSSCPSQEQPKPLKSGASVARLPRHARRVAHLVAAPRGLQARQQRDELRLRPSSVSIGSFGALGCRTSVDWIVFVEQSD